MSDEHNDYEIGFSKPPKRSRFQKGRSGNPRGRPKGSKNVPALIRRIFGETISVKGPDGIHSITKLEAAITQLANKSAAGDLKAIVEMLRIERNLPSDAPSSAPRRLVISFVKPGDPLEGLTTREAPTIDADRPAI